ncbi:MAG TPA: long-chain fatty acid--CoA ligase [Thermoanaerobacterales bacterium]|nr:long-chain fatty acid--CoA ligase [Thermoanaerobacterales bacterium]
MFGQFSNNWMWVGNICSKRAEYSPNREAVYDCDYKRRFTYSDLEERANKLANYLAKEMGIKKGDRVAFISRNRIEMLDAYFATGKLGAIYVPYNIRLSPVELKQLINDETPRVLIYEDLFNDLVDGIKPYIPIKNYVAITEMNKNTSDLNYEVIMNYTDNSPFRCRDLRTEDIHLILHTGGTTGLPKGAMISHGAMIANAVSEIITWNINQNDVAHILLPLFHTGGWNLLTLPILYAGGRIIINRSFDPKLTLELIEKERTTLVFGAATIFRMIAQLPEFNNTDFSSVRWMMAGAAPTPVELMEEFWKKGIRFILGYGLTEGGPTNLSIPAEFMNFDEIRNKAESVGKPFIFTEARIVDENGNDVGPNEIGELIFSGPQIFSGYWNKPEETQKTLKEGWVYTGDLAKKDEDGFYYIVDRKKDMYISGGENVYPTEIEKVLYQMPEVKECCVIGVPDEKWGEVGKIIISVKPGFTLNKKQVIDFFNGKLARYKIPKYVTFVEDLPKSSAGKIVKSEVKKMYGGAHD